MFAKSSFKLLKSAIDLKPKLLMDIVLPARDLDPITDLVFITSLETLSIKTALPLVVDPR